MYVKPPDGRVLVTAPFLYTEREIKSFVTAKADWIRKHQERIRSKSAQSRRALEYKTGETLYFWGRPYRLTVIEDPAAKRSRLELDPKPEFTIDDTKLKLFRHPGSLTKPLNNEQNCAVMVVPSGSTHEQREQLVKNKYKQLLDQEAERVLAFWSEQTGLEYSSWHSRYMVSRWGSLIIKTKRVCLNTRLAEKPEICLIYVALHEIAHVQEPNHGPRFKAILDKYMPDWREAERILKY